MSYTRDMIEELLPGIWDSAKVLTKRNPYAPDPEMPKPKQNPAHGNTKVAMLADVQLAWRRAKMSQRQRQALLLVGAFDYAVADVAAELGLTYNQAAKARDEGVEALGLFLNGRPFAVSLDEEVSA